MKFFLHIQLRRFVLITIAILLVYADLDALSQEPDYRRIPIPKRSGECGDIETQIIASNAALAEFVRKIKRQNLPKLRNEVIEALKYANLNFAREFLVLVTDTEGSGSIRVNLDTVFVESRRFYCKITRKAPLVQTDDMAYYCWSFAVNRWNVDDVEIQIEGREKIALSIAQPRDPERQRKSKLPRNFSFGFELYKNKQHAKAVQYFWKVVHADSARRFPGAFRYLSDSYLELHEPDSARMVYKMGRKLLPGNDDIWKDYEGKVDEK